MGRDVFLKKVKKMKTLCIVLGILVFLLGIFFLLISFFGDAGGFAVLAIFFIVCAVLFFVGAGKYSGGENSKYIKSMGNILDLADDLHTTVVYEDDRMIISEKAFGAKKNGMNVAARGDVLAAYEHTIKDDLVTLDRTVDVLIRDGRQFTFPFRGKKEEVNDFLQIIGHYCHNAAIGYSPDTLRYVHDERKAYREKKKGQK